MTPNEILLYAEVYNEKEVEAYKKILYGAWHQVAFKRSKKLPDLKDMLNKLDKKEVKKQEIPYQKIARLAKERGLKLPESFLAERRANNG